MNLCVTVSSFASLDFPACFCGSCGETVKPVCCRAHETDTRSADMAEHLHPLCRSHDPQSAADLRPFRGIRSVRGARRCRWKSRRSHGERPSARRVLRLCTAERVLVGDPLCRTSGGCQSLQRTQGKARHVIDVIAKA